MKYLKYFKFHFFQKIKDFGLTYCSNGDLLSLIKKSTKFSLPMAEFYAAEIVSGLEYMHDKKVIHR